MSEAHGARAYDPAKRQISRTVRAILEDEVFKNKERDRWRRIVSLVWGEKSCHELQVNGVAPVLQHAIGEALYDARQRDPRALSDILMLADTWISSVNEALRATRNSAAAAELRFWSLSEIAWHASLCAAKAPGDQDQAVLIRQLFFSFATLFGSGLRQRARLVLPSEDRSALSRSAPVALDRQERFELSASFVAPLAPGFVENNQGTVYLAAGARDRLSE